MINFLRRNIRKSVVVDGMNYFLLEGYVYLFNNSYIYIYILMVFGEGKRVCGVYLISCVEYYLIVVSNEICLKLNF